MSRDDECQDSHKHRDKQLPRPEVTLEEERNEREYRTEDATDRLRTEMENQARHQTTEADEQTLERAVEHREHTGKAHRDTSETTQEAHEDPHLQDDVLFECPTVGTLVVLIEEIHHQRCPHQRDAKPDPEAPDLIPEDEGEELYQEEEGRGIAPGKKKVLARRYSIDFHLSTDMGYDFKFIVSSHIQSIIACYELTFTKITLIF